MSIQSLGQKIAEAGLKAINKTLLGSGITLITAEQLMKVAKAMSPERAMIMAGLLNDMCPVFGIKTKDALHEFLANVLHESGEFTERVENMNYRAATIVRVWPSRFAMPDSKGAVPKGKLDANKYARNPKALAVATYGGRMGNRPGTEDGWQLRGSGFIGLTGFYIFDAFRKFKGWETVEETAQYCRNSDRGGLESALWYFCVLKDLIDDAERDEMIGIVRDINGGLIGLKDRQKYYELAKKYVV